MSAHRPRSPPATSAQPTQRRSPSVARRNASIANGQDPEDEIPRVDRIRDMADEEHRVDPQPVVGEVEPAGECRQRGRDQRDISPTPSSAA
jgi:hypothetical protein